MRYNKQELVAISTQPSPRFEKEGILHIRERQEGFFKRIESLERWCRLRGNLLFIFRTKDPWSEPACIVVLENCQVRIDPPSSFQGFKDDNLFSFYLVFDGGLSQALAANSDTDRLFWINAIRAATLDKIRIEITTLLKCLKPRLENRRSCTPKISYISDVGEVSICELALSCDNLLCDIYGCRPNAYLTIEVYLTTIKSWTNFGTTEIIENNSNPSFLKTVSLRSSDGVSLDSKLKITVFDVKEKLSHTVLPLGSVCILLSVVLDSTRIRLPLVSSHRNTIGFLSISSWSLKEDNRGSSTESTPSKTPLHSTTQIWSHRRSHSLPPRLGVKMSMPNQNDLKLFYSSIYLETYRFHSGLGGDICVYEFMGESRLCFTLPCLLLDIWIQQEKELLQEVLGMGELDTPWCSRQMELLDKHLHMLRIYSQARERLQSRKKSFFKHSTEKFDRYMEFAPLNLHLQRMWVYNDTINKSGIYDWITVGAFTAYCHKNKNGGLLRLVQEMKESPLRTNASTQTTTKISMTCDVIQAIKQLREDVVKAMKALTKLAKDQQSNGMLPICEDLINKTRILLSLWDPALVEEALSFIEEHKLASDCNIYQKPIADSLEERQYMSPFKKISQQLLELRLESPEIEDLATPCTPNDQFNWEESITQAVSSLETQTEHMQNRQIPINKPESCSLSEDANEICNSPHANYYKPSEEPEPLDITQLNIEASVMCLVSKVKFLCGRTGSPAIRLRKQAKPQEVVKVGNKFTDGLDLNEINDWSAELRPSMRKLRQAMDGLLKTARLAHSVFRLQVDFRITQRISDIQYRRDVCFSQSLTALVTALITRLWAPTPDVSFIGVLESLGPLACFEGLLSYHGNEIDMWGDMSIAIEDLKTVTFSLVRCQSPMSTTIQHIPTITGSRTHLKVALPVSDSVLALVSSKHQVSFHVIPVFFNIGINDKATLAEGLGATKTQNASNVDNYDRLNEYFLRYKKLLEKVYGTKYCKESASHLKQVTELMGSLNGLVHMDKPKNVEVLHTAALICRLMKGFRFTSCKSGKDRTAMSVTLEQCSILQDEYHLAKSEFQKVLDCIRSEGCRRENVLKNIGVRKYAFNCVQVLALPRIYRPPVGTYGCSET